MNSNKKLINIEYLPNYEPHSKTKIMEIGKNRHSQNKFTEIKRISSGYARHNS